MAKITLEERIEQSQKIVMVLAKKIQQQSEEEKVKIVYNHAVEDILDAIEIFADKNPQHNLVFMALREELSAWKLVCPLEDASESEDDV